MIFDNKFRKQVEKYLSESKHYPDIFNKDEINELVDFMFKGTKWWRTSPTGNLFLGGNFNQLFEKHIKHKIENLLDTSLIKTCSGNFFHTPHQYGVHTDMPEPDNTYDKSEVTYKSILVPLYMLPDTHNGRIVFYDQRVIDSGCTFDWGPHRSTTHYRSFTDYSKIDHVYTFDKGYHTIDTNEKMSQEIFENSGLQYAPSKIDRYHGLSIENSFPWLPGSLYVFDTCQVHSSTLGEKSFITKAGLRISFITERTNES